MLRTRRWSPSMWQYDGSKVLNLLWWLHSLGPKTCFPSAGSLGAISSTNADSKLIAILTNTELTGVSLLSKLTSCFLSDIILGLASCQFKYSAAKTESWFFFPILFFLLLLYYSLFSSQVNVEKLLTSVSIFQQFFPNSPTQLLFKSCWVPICVTIKSNLSESLTQLHLLYVVYLATSASNKAWQQPSNKNPCVLCFPPRFWECFWCTATKPSHGPLVVPL